MWDRLPLYIIACYPAFATLAYESVRVLGIFKRSALAGAVAVAFVCQVFYEIFDQLGPQLKWWAWNDANTDVNHPALASVPMNSMLLFAAVSFENLEQDIARGNGEYLTSLGVLLDIPAGEEREFASSTQRDYPLLFSPERRTAESLLSMLRNREARPSSIP